MEWKKVVEFLFQFVSRILVYTDLNKPQFSEHIFRIPVKCDSSLSELGNTAYWITDNFDVFQELLFSPGFVGPERRITHLYFYDKDTLIGFLNLDDEDNFFVFVDIPDAALFGEFQKCELNKELIDRNQLILAEITEGGEWLAVE